MKKLVIDDSLARRAIQGDEDAWVEIVEVASPALIRTLGRIFSVPRVRAEDIVQETWYRAYKNRFQWEPMRGGFETWVTGICLNHAKDEFKRASNNETPIGLGENVVNLTTGSNRSARVDASDQTDLSVDMCRLLMELPHVQREVVVLADFLGFSGVEIAKILGAAGRPTSENTVRSRLSTGRRRLKKMIQEQPPSASSQDGGTQ